MSGNFRNLAVALGCTSASLLSACGPKTDVPSNFASCKTPSVICLPAGSTTGVCVDIANDPNNCGECGNVCDVPQQGGIAACVQGACVLSCTAGLTVCGLTTNTDGGGTGAEICIDTSVDPNHCGNCNTHCLDNQVCTASACVTANADAGTTVCSFGADGGPVYANLNTDRANCGTCGATCGSTEICLSGACAPCDVAQCNNVCVNTNTDTNNCGACGAVVASGGCDNGTARPLPVITVLPPGSTGFLPTGNPTFSMSVKSGIRLAQVTAVAKLTRNGVTSTSSAFNLTLGSDANLSPTAWSFTWSGLATPSGGTLPALAVGDTLQIDLSAYDEQYLATRADAAQHTSSLAWTGQVVVPVPVNLATPTASTTVGTAANTALAAQSWVPLNGAPITFTESPTAAPSSTSRIAGIQFWSVGGGGTNILGGAANVLPISNGAATITVNPADLGVGTRSIVAYQIDYFGNPLNPSSVLVLTVGDITLNAGAPAQPILTHGNDGNDSIWLLGAAQATPAGAVCAGPANYLVQAYDQPAASPSAVGKTVEGTNYFCQSSFFETYESTGVYGVLSTGAGITRFDGAAAATAGFITPQGTNKIARIEPNSITAVALAVDDFTIDGGSGNGAFALAAKGSSANAEQEAGGADGGAFFAVPQVGGLGGATSKISSSSAGALWAWVQVPTGNSAAGPSAQYQLDIFHPAISNNSTQIKSYLATGTTGPATPISLTVFPGGEYVWEEIDAATGFLSMGAGRFDGTNQPVDLTNASASGVVLSGNAFAIGVQHTLTSANFFVPSPGILVGVVPSRAGVGSGASSISAGYEVVEIDVSGTQAKIYHPQLIQVNGTTASGEVLTSGVSDRYGNFNTFTVSDDLKKVLYVTKATSVAPARDTYTINLLDLATGTASAIYSSQFINNDDKTDNGGAAALTVYPHFLHGVNSYAGLSAARTTPTIVRWNEELPVAGGTATSTVYERLYYANYASTTVTPVQIDHLGFAAYQGSPPGLGAAIGGTIPVNQLVAESVKADAIYFLSDDGGGQLSLYSRAFDGSAGATLVTKGVSAWNLREDVGEQVVLRVDGTLLSGPLSAGAAGQLTAIYQSDSGGAAVNLTLAPLAGITGDGSSAFVVVHADQIYVSGVVGNQHTQIPLLTGDLITIDLTTGARTSWGPAYGYLLEVSGLPFVELGGKTLYGTDLATATEVFSRFYSATSAAPTAHKSIFGPVPFSSYGSSLPTYSVDNKEALFSPFSGVSYDLTSDPTTATPFNAAFTLSGPLAQARPSLPVFGPPRLPLWAFASVSGGILFKPFGGTYTAPITVSKTGTASYTTANNRLTPDFSQLLAHFVDSSGQPFVMKLPGTGVAPTVLPPQ